MWTSGKSEALRHRGHCPAGDRACAVETGGGPGVGAAARGPVRRRPRYAGSKPSIARASFGESSASAASGASPTFWPRERSLPGGPITTRRGWTGSSRRRRAAAGAARQWLSDGVYNLEVRPYPEFQTATACRCRPLETAAPARRPESKFPDLERATLSNGLKVVLARRPVHSPGAIRSAAGRRLCR